MPATESLRVKQGLHGHGTFSIDPGTNVAMGVRLHISNGKVKPVGSLSLKTKSALVIGHMKKLKG